MANQQELFQADTQWFHVFRNMIDSGDLAKLDGAAIKVYLVIKAHTNYQTGNALPSIERIADQSGLSVAHVKRKLIDLETQGYLTKEKKGRNNIYTLREKISLADQEGVQQAVASWDYVPSGVREAVADLKHVMLTGDLAGAKIVQIEHLQVQVINGEHASGVMVQEADLLKAIEKNPALFERLAAAQEKARRKE